MFSPHQALRALCPLLLVLAATLSTATSADMVGADNNQIIYLREDLARSRFFDRLPVSLAADHPRTDVPGWINACTEQTRKNFQWALREPSLNSLMTYAAGSTAFSAMALAGWWKRATLMRYATSLKPDTIALITVPVASVAPLLLMLSVYPIKSVAEQIFYTIKAPKMPEADLVYQYGGKKSLLDPSTQAYIEDELFYNFWQTPSSESFTRLHKILDKALRLPLYTKALNYDQQAISEALKHFPREVVDRLQRFALAEILYQQMTPPPSGRFPIYLQGEPGTGKTYAASQLAKAMGTTLAVVNLDGASIEDMVGTPFESVNAHAGRLLDAMIANTTSTHDINHQNQVLLIDEFDRLLVAEDRRSQDVLSFMLKLLDPNKRQFYSPYLKANIRLPDTVILAGNSDLQILARHNPRLEALTSRLDSLRFPGFNAEAKQDIADSAIIPRLAQSYQSLPKVPKDFTLSDQDREQVMEFITRDTDPGLRNLEKFIHQKFEQKMLDFNL